MAIKTKKILVPLDGSKNSIRGLDMAIHIARQSHGTITALSVKSVPGIYALHPLGFLDFNSMTEVKKLLDNAKVRAAKKGIQLTAKALAGDPGYDIARFANNARNGIDLVVIGARGRGSAKEMFLGSVSNYVLHKSKKTSIDCKMINNYSFRKILVPIDGSKFSEKALQRACGMTETSDAKIILLYVVEKSPTLNILDRNEYLKLIRKFGTNILKKANDIVLKKGLNSKTILKEGNIVAEIEKTVKTEKCDLIIVGNKGLGSVFRILLGSVSNKLAQSSTCSLLIVK